jgi:hypothetical protein
MSLGTAANTADPDAYNVMTITEPNLSPADIAKITLIGWANKTPSLFGTISQTSPEALATLQRSLDQTLSQLTNLVARRTFTLKQRDFLIVQSSERKVPPQAVLPPFQIALNGRTFSLRSLPSVNADLIGTFAGNDVVAEIDCYTIPCTNGWVGLRATKDKTILRGWISAEDLKTVVTPGLSIEIGYDGKRVAPKRESTNAIRLALRRDASAVPVRARIQVIAARSIAENLTSSFLAGARLSYLDRLLIDLGVRPEDIVKTVIDVPTASSLPLAIVNFR